MLTASECRSVAASGVAASTWAAIWLASRRVRSAVAATPPAISTTMVHCASQIARDGASITGTGWASAYAAAAADSSATAAPPTATGAFTTRTIRGARSHRHAARTAMPVPVPTVRARPQRIRLARRSGAACTSARLAAHVKHPLASRVEQRGRQQSADQSRHDEARGRDQPVPAAQRPDWAGERGRAEERRGQRGPGEHDGEQQRRGCLRHRHGGDHDGRPRQHEQRAAQRGRPVRGQCGTGGDGASTAAAACRATCQGAPPPGAVSGYEAASRTIGTPSASTAAAISAGMARDASDAALPLAFMTGECQRLR